MRIIIIVAVELYRGAVMTAVTISGKDSLALLEELTTWGDLTTIILHGGSVFEFKGPFPQGVSAEGYYNLKGPGKGSAAGFEGHLNLQKIDTIQCLEKQHRGRDSYAFVFLDQQGSAIFKVFLGRDAEGNIYENQLAAFKAIQHK